MWEVNILGLARHHTSEELAVDYALQLLACIDISIGIFKNAVLPTHKRKRFVSLKSR